MNPTQEQKHQCYQILRGVWDQNGQQPFIADMVTLAQVLEVKFREASMIIAALEVEGRLMATPDHRFAGLRVTFPDYFPLAQASTTTQTHNRKDKP